MVNSNHNCPRDKLGVALAGGGFRATIFHIGVLKRLAELDMLRYVEVISSVSGGSIIGALYVLLLKRELEHPECPGSLTQAQYLTIVEQLEHRLVKGIQKNPRTKLLMNPFALIQLVLTGGTFGTRMANLYERYIFKQTIAEIEKQVIGEKRSQPKRPWFCQGKIRLHEIKIFPKSFNPKEEDIESYNKKQVANKTGSVITKLVLNATTLNTGTRFFFTSSELGDWIYGHIREDEINRILAIKKILEPSSDNIAIKGTVYLYKKITRPLKLLAQPFKYKGLYTTTKSKTYFYNSAEQEELLALNVWIMDHSNIEQLPDKWKSLIFNIKQLNFLTNIEMGTLRSARVEAWHISKIDASERHESGGYNREQHLDILNSILSDVFHQLPDEVSALINNNIKNGLLDLIELIYLIRSASMMSFNIRKDWDGLSLAQAVAISANFPPVFKPFRLTNIYDDAEVDRLGLSDGGIFDNLGVYGLIDENCNHMISSDTGKKMQVSSSISGNRKDMMFRIVDVLMDVNVNQTKQTLIERFNVSNGLGRIGRMTPIEALNENALKELRHFQLPRTLPGLAVFHINSPQAQQALKNIPYKKNGKIVTANINAYSTKDLAEIRTDLDAFGDIESAALINQGYINAELFLKHYFQPYNKDGNYSHRSMQYRYQDTACDYPYLDNTQAWPEAITPNSIVCELANSDSKEGANKSKNNKLIKWAISVAKKRFGKWLSIPPFPSPIYISWLIVAISGFGLLSLASQVKGSFNDMYLNFTSYIKNEIPFIMEWGDIQLNLAYIIMGIFLLSIIYKLIHFVFNIIVNIIDCFFKTKLKQSNLWRKFIRVSIYVLRKGTFGRDFLLTIIPIFIIAIIANYIYYAFSLPYLWATSLKKYKNL